MSDPEARLRKESIAIVGVGGTGSHVLDFVSKTAVQSIDLFDGDAYLERNALRSPGPFIRHAVPCGLVKASHHGTRYSGVHDRIRCFDVSIDTGNVVRLGEYSTVFLCIGGSALKHDIFKVCASTGTFVIDVGMGVSESTAPADGGARYGLVSTAGIPPGAPYQEHISFEEPESDASDNLQTVELNALNAALAVIKWKKHLGVVLDTGKETSSLYAIHENHIYNKD